MNDEEKRRHARTKLILKIIGPVIIAGGVVLAAIGFIDLFSHNGMPGKSRCLMLGLPVIAIGGMITMFAFKKEITRYVKNESVDIINETAKEIKPAVADIASAAKSGLTSDTVICECGETNDKNNKFCKACGRPLRKTCPDCGSTAEADSVFCGNCGKKL